ncbi:hypothetical protein MXL46_11240 [Heyndrickxia sporothermodurans]|uniref:Uncharacterized protein n=1 Tax=Siminovitchia terrae TaxID=1914933 RepID=A0A429X9N6_SIMTE|nr:MULTISPECIES: hypothetical protein [Bacillaceae]MEB6549660.1 hypothetical protein [Heyndrickxia sporothermodurans]RST60100.1 hypothetical protein D5F11_008525 [Siminovitchia terrae]
MNIKEHNLIMINDENGEDVVGDFLNHLYQKSKESDEAKLHLMFLNSAFNLLSVQPLDTLIKRRTEITITFNGEQRTRRYHLVKPLRVIPIYELRYAMSGNEHLRFLFFPFEYKDQSNYVFVKCFIKTLDPNIDETDRMRDLTYQMYERVKENPELYLEGIEE